MQIFCHRQVNNLQFLHIGHNEIMDLMNFTRATIPSGVIVGIDSNKINCTHMRHIFDALTLKKFRLFQRPMNCSSQNEEDEVPQSTTVSEKSSTQTTTATLTMDPIKPEIQNVEPSKFKKIPSRHFAVHRMPPEAKEKLDKLERDHEILTEVKKSHAAIIDHMQSDLVEHLALMTSLFAICLGVIIIISAALVTLCWCRFLKKQSPADSKSKFVTFQRPNKVTLF